MYAARSNVCNAVQGRSLLSVLESEFNLSPPLPLLPEDCQYNTFDPVPPPTRVVDGRKKGENRKENKEIRALGFGI
jgi:hypothetical protein